MSRPLPPAVERARRAALSEFYAGHLSAGEFSDRLTKAENPSREPAEHEPSPAPPDHPQRRRLNGLVVLLAVGAAGGGIGIAAGSQLSGSRVIRGAAHRATPRKVTRPTHHYASHPATVTAAAPYHPTGATDATGSIGGGMVLHRAPRKLTRVRSRRSTHRPRPAASTVTTTTATTAPTTTATQTATTPPTTPTTQTAATTATTTSPNAPG